MIAFLGSLTYAVIQGPGFRLDRACDPGAVRVAVVALAVLALVERRARRRLTATTTAFAHRFRPPLSPTFTADA